MQYSKSHQIQPNTTQFPWKTKKSPKTSSRLFFDKFPVLSAVELSWKAIHSANNGNNNQPTTRMSIQVTIIESHSKWLKQLDYPYFTHRIEQKTLKFFVSRHLCSKFVHFGRLNSAHSSALFGAQFIRLLFSTKYNKTFEQRDENERKTENVSQKHPTTS